MIKIINNKQLYNNYLNIRKKVFIEEQNTSLDIEIENEDISTGFLIFENEIPVGGARYRIYNKEYAKIERVCILKEYRGKGYGNKLLTYIINYLKIYTDLILLLNAQTVAIDFYKKLGFKIVGDKFIEADIEHYQMILN